MSNKKKKKQEPLEKEALQARLSKAVSEEEIKEMLESDGLLNQIVTEMMKGQSLSTPVRTNLKEIVHAIVSSGNTDLLTLMKIDKTMMNHEDFEDQLYKELSDPQRFFSMIGMCNDDMFFDLEELLEEQIVPVDIDDVNLKMFFFLGVVFLFYDEEKDTFYWVLPDETIELFTTSDIIEDLLESRTFIWNTYEMIQAATNLYGWIDVKELLSLINGYGEEDQEDISEEILMKVFSIASMVDQSVVLKKHIFIHKSLEGYSIKKIQDLYRSTLNKPLYIPEEEEFFDFCEGDGFLFDEVWEMLGGFLLGETDEENEDIDDLLIEIHQLFQQGAPVKEWLKPFQEREIYFYNDDQIHTLILLMNQAHEQTRIWRNRGYTPHEMRVKEATQSINLICEEADDLE